jgi:hypothetical protein
VLYELRIYTVETGRMAALQHRFRDHTCGFFARHGFRPVGFWTNAIGGRNDELWYLLEWDDLAARERAWAGFLADPDWLAVRAASTVDGPLVLRAENRIMRPTEFSPLGLPGAPFVASRTMNPATQA